MKIKSLSIFYRSDNSKAQKWEAQILAWLKNSHPRILIDSKKPQALIVLGGDGAILEAVKKYQKVSPIIVGLNLGRIGFLASARRETQFFTILEKLIAGKFAVTKRMMIKISVQRNGKNIFQARAFNEATIQSLLGMVELEVLINSHPFQYVRGSGILVSTATGSTAYNLSAHGPVVMPDIKCLIITELLDHNTPTPSLVVKRNKKIEIKVLAFRKQGLLSLSSNAKPVDVLLTADADTIFPVEKGDIIKIERSKALVKYAEFEPNYFLKSLNEKFGYR